MANRWVFVAFRWNHELFTQLYTYEFAGWLQFSAANVIFWTVGPNPDNKAEGFFTWSPAAQTWSVSGSVWWQIFRRATTVNRQYPYRSGIPFFVPQRRIETTPISVQGQTIFTFSVSS